MNLIQGQEIGTISMDLFLHRIVIKFITPYEEMLTVHCLNGKLIWNKSMKQYKTPQLIKDI